MQHDFVAEDATPANTPTMTAQAEDRRSGARLLTVYRVARVLADGRYGFVRVLNMSNEGMMLSTALPVERGDALQVDLSESCSMIGEVRWHRDGRCGLKLAEPIDSTALLSRLYEECQRSDARQLRLPLERTVVLTSELGIQISRTRDISQRGLKLAHDGRLHPGLSIRIQFAPGIERRGTVRWVRDGIAGCMLIERLSVEEIERLVLA